MTPLLRLLWLLAACASTASVARPLTDYPFRIETVREATGEQVVARNDGPAAITLHVGLVSENVRSATAWPVTAVIPAGGQVMLGQVGPADREKPYRYLFNYTYYAGRLDAPGAAVPLYRLPYANGAAFAITQAHGGPLTSHDNRQNLHAVDFAMPVGTPLVAAREGVVVDVALRHQRGGTDPALMEEVNFITIMHDDGTLAEYAHLSPGPALVKRGQRVAAGTLIGHSGNTGYSSGPHLHFVVSRPDVERGRVIRHSLPIVFYGDDRGTPLTPRAGTVALADYRQPPAVNGPALAARPTEEAVAPLTAQGSTEKR